MRNVPYSLTNGGGPHPATRPTRRQAYLARITTIARAEADSRVGDEETPTRCCALLTLLMLLALALATLLSQLEQAGSAQALAIPPALSVATGPTAPTIHPGVTTASPRTGISKTVHTRPAAFTRIHPAHEAHTLDDSVARVHSTTALTKQEALRLTLRTTPGLVNITTELPGGGGEAGTGIVLRSSGLVLTAGHVVTDAVRVHALDLGDGLTYPATVIGIDHRHDIALIQLDGATGLRTARLSDSPLHPGDQVASIGNAYGRGYPTLGTGPVTALHQTIPTTTGSTSTRQLTGLIEADNGIVPGQSGGPMVDRHGEVVGVNDAYRMTAAEGAPTGIGYAVPIATALRSAHTLLAQHFHESEADTSSAA
jgi:S1-C subfamily serine protease